MYLTLSKINKKIDTLSRATTEEIDELLVLTDKSTPILIKEVVYRVKGYFLTCLLQVPAVYILSVV